MKTLLLNYYNMDIDYLNYGYFTYQNGHYFIMKSNNSFFEIYSLYEYMIEALQKKGYKIVRNKFDQVMSEQYIVFSYEYEKLDIKKYIYYTFKPLQIYNLNLNSIKERWIEKIDCVRKEVGKYSYSFQYNKDLNALIHYYCGMGENAITLLNEILYLDKKAFLPLCLSLRHKINLYYHEMLNPCYYDISTRSRHLIYLLKSNIISFDDFDNIVQDCHFNYIELMYLFARGLYCSEFFDFIMEGKIENDRIDYFKNNIRYNQEFLKLLRKKLTKFISLPEISWLD